MAIRLFVVALTYFASGWLGLQMPYLGQNITLVWLPTGIAVAALYRWGRPVLPAVLVASFLVNLSVGSAWPTAVGIALGNSLGPLLSAEWLRRQGFHTTFDRQRDVALFTLAAAGGMLVNASGGVACLYWVGVMPAESVGTAWLSWWMGDTVGALLAGPLLLSINRKNLAQFSRDRKALLLWLLISIPVAWFAFVHDYVHVGRSLPLAFLTLPLFAWAALRFGVIGAALAGIGFSVVAAWSTARGHGTFALPDMQLSLLLLWTYMASTVLTGLLITALQAERLQAEVRRDMAEQQEHGRNHMLALLAADAPLRDILETMVRGVEQALTGTLCSILLLDKEGKHLEQGVAPSLPDFYNTALEGIEIGVGVGSCGTAAFTGTRVIVEDIATHPYWTAYRDLAARAGLASCWSQPIYASSGKVLGSFAIYQRQISVPDADDLVLIEQSGRLASIAIERKRADMELRQSERKFSTAFSSCPIAASIATVDNGLFIEVNENYERDFGWTRDDLIGRSSVEVGVWPDRETRAPWVEAIRREGRLVNYETIWMHKNGQRRDVSLSAEFTELNGRSCVLAYATDITEHKAAEERIHELAFFDTLTGLPNRTLLLDRLKHAMTAGTCSASYGSMLIIDLDHFKTLNDTLGHDIGDLLLQQVARRVVTCVNEGVTVARIGGDEFVVVLENLSDNLDEALTQTEAVGAKILTTLNGTYQLKVTEYRSTASIGATLFHGHLASIDDLMKQADLAMYKSKQTGRNALHFFDPAMQTLLIERAAMEASLRTALEEQQFIVHYQPQVVDTGRVTGAEALVRWQHPERGVVAPANFIPLAEETGLILALGQWVLKTACAQLALWATLPELKHLTVAVNVSAKEFGEPDYVSKVMAVLHATGADPKKLKLELTESLLVNNIEDVIEKMFALRAKGVGFSLDDFGTGYSSLSYLKRLPLDQLKIDQSFVRDVLVDANDAAIARTVVALAHSLGLGVIAEGVETEAQRVLLAGSGCHAYQGYYFSRPLPVAEFEVFVQGV